MADNGYKRIVRGMVSRYGESIVLHNNILLSHRVFFDSIINGGVNMAETTIGVSDALKARLVKLKRYDRESYEEVIKRLLKTYKESKSENVIIGQG